MFTYEFGSDLSTTNDHTTYNKPPILDTMTSTAYINTKHKFTKSGTLRAFEANIAKTGRIVFMVSFDTLFG